MGLFRNEATTPTDALIDAVRDEMHRSTIGSDEYTKMTAQLKALHEIKATERRKSISPDTMALIIGSFLNIITIGIIERTHVMSSKSFSQLVRPR